MSGEISHSLRASREFGSGLLCQGDMDLVIEGVEPA